MRRHEKSSQIRGAVRDYARDIMSSSRWRGQCRFLQHGNVTVCEHCENVACLSLRIARLLHVNADERSLARGALLHDYFLYDWHQAGSPKWHGLVHPAIACRNAERDFALSARERDIIIKHMFPLTVRAPRYRESVIVCLADKIEALKETFHRRG